MKLQFAGDTVVCTPEHPFFVGGHWVDAGKLKSGDSPFALNGSKVCINSVSKFKTDTATLVYNFKADSTHCYFVGGAAVLAHNASSDYVQFGKNKVLKELFHGPGGIKEKILQAVGEKKFSWKVGTNPDIKIINSRIHLTGSSTSPFKGKTYPTNLKSIDYFDF